MSKEIGARKTLIKGKLLRVSHPRTVESPTSKSATEIYRFGIKTKTEKRVLFSLTTTQMGWGKLESSKIYYHNNKNDRIIKTSMANPERFVGQDVAVRGFMEILDKHAQKYKMVTVDEVILYLE